jgi:thymidylate synthase
MADVDVVFASMLGQILKHGVEINTRNSITKRLTGMQVKFSKTPLISVRTTAWKNAIREMEWFLTGSSNINDLNPKAHHWWKPWADENGEVKNNYSKQLRHFSYPEGAGSTFDQVEFFLQAVRNHPNSRRTVMTTWNPAEMAAPITPITNCHGTVIQAFVSPENKLEILMYQRSSDMLLGMPHNWIQYWAFLMYAAKQTGRDVGSFTWIGGDCHLYKDHYELAEEIIQRQMEPGCGYNLIYGGEVGDAFKADDFSLDRKYEPIITKSAKMVV